MDPKKLHQDVITYNKKLNEIRREIRKCIVGQENVVNAVLKSFICNGHVLLEGVPGIAKTLLVMALTKTIKDANFQRIQFTPDLLPTDITGMTVYEKERGFYTVKGPIFANIVIGDEINRTPPKVQSAMLQAMQEREVTLGKETFPLPKPFFVIATQNPLETRGVYPMPEAQVDRFFFKIIMTYNKKNEEILIIDQNIAIKDIDEFGITPVINVQEILEVQNLIRNIYISDEIKKYIVKIVNATRKPETYEIKEGKYMQWGASPRASINLSIAAKATALTNNRTFVIPEDVREIAHDILRHRVILNYEGKAKGIETDQIVESIIQSVPVI